jgi:hypothetical protein
MSFDAILKYINIGGGITPLFAIHSPSFLLAIQLALKGALVDRNELLNSSM